uniref:Uncharacterized protein n=1 Tax=Plectus sambesii TaxID=2011161 RepID=A0A914UK14_9BILA
MVGIVTTAPKIYRLKVIVAGESCVGKSAIAQVLAGNASNFPKAYSMTPGIELHQKSFTVAPQVSVELLLVDASGNILYDWLVMKSLPKDAILCLVFDMTNRSSFDKMAQWATRIQPFLAKGMPGLILGNKSDLSSRRMVSESVARDFAQQHQLLYFECSAKANTDLQDSFKALAAEWYQRTK